MINIITKSEPGAMEYVTKAAHDRGILPVYWDTGGAGSDQDAFGMFDRNSNAVLHPEILKAMMRAVTKSYDIKDIDKP